MAEGRLKTPADAVRALELGAHAVVVGSAITRPDDVTRWFTAALRTLPGRWPPDDRGPDADHRGAQPPAGADRVADPGPATRSGLYTRTPRRGDLPDG
ncbi:hypothetical protein [Deinococcus sp. LM3]|uniref:hypothetical protein n=1 Tax=Deinococcus sp. LM3 TaxID=1938608 RepID=UPI0023E4563F|nr:hypothetical protein [Deinococcus sp. LM3]